MIPGPEGNDIQLYVYTQKSGKYSTIIDRTAIKLQIIDTDYRYPSRRIGCQHLKLGVFSQCVYAYYIGMQ